MPWINLGAPFLARSRREKWRFSTQSSHKACPERSIAPRVTVRLELVEEPALISSKRASGPPRRRYLNFSAVLSLLLVAILLSNAAPEKHLSIFSTAANYSVTLVQRDNRDYIGVLELLEPLGKVSVRADGPRWRVRYNNVAADFQAGKNRARIEGRDVDLSAPFLLENIRGLVPVASLSALLPRILGGPVTLHEASGRLFIGNIATHFTASLAGDNPPRLVFVFTSPVSPSVATEPGTLRMTFYREPVVAPASPLLTFGSKMIPSATYSEGNGVAVVTVNATAPVIATFSNGGRTVTISPTSTAAQATAPATAPQTTPQSTAPAPATPQQPPQSAPARRYFAVVDASHGGGDKGEAISTTLAEKDITITLAQSLRQELESRGIPTLLLRDSDANLTLDQRASSANASHAAIYIALHAASSGRGVRIFTALFPYGEDDRGPFASWTTAQRPSLPLSQTAASAVVAELQRRQIPVRNLSAPLRPLNNITVPALAVEVAPQGSDARQLTAPDYQQLITSAVATAVAASRNQLGATP
jgi:N-acetylmuramoyl-L-alanine amidase